MIDKRVVIVGRPNVGKSTLFNRLAGQKLAIVHDRPGVTRDWREAEARLGPLHFTLVDTPGFEDGDIGALEARMRAATLAAIADADVCLFVVDARAGTTALDVMLADLLRRSGKPVVLVANKYEGRAAEAGMLEAGLLGFGPALALSAEHNLGLDALFDALDPLLKPEGEEDAQAQPEEDADRPLRLAVVGRPNVGKSSLINRLVGRVRFVTGPEAGITRDSVAVDVTLAGTPVRIFDTAGLRKRARVVDDVERLSTGETVRAIRFAEAVLLLVDATQPFEKQDLAIADLVVREGRALVIAVNKWDLIDDRANARRALHATVEAALPQIRGVPTVFVSAETGEGVKDLIPTIRRIVELWSGRLPTAALNRWFEEVLARHPPPLVQGRRLKLRYITQAKVRPPGFVIFTTRPADVPDDYVRYIVNSLRETFDLWGVPVRVHLRKGKNPYADE